jgi:FAD-dependent urate hydroxylase
MNDCDVVVIGAGPYGLSITAHLRARSIDSIMFGEPMAFWEKQMPDGMLLRSPWAASHLSDPRGELTLDTYRLTQRKQFSSPVPREEFVSYGKWFQHKVAPDVDPRLVTCVEKNGDFRLSLSDGQQLKAAHVVVAAGIASFSRKLQQFKNLPSELVTHASDHRDFKRLAERKVMIIGGGQSGLESAALLHEAGAQVELLVRAPKITWLTGKKWLSSCLPLRRMLYAPTDIGPPGASQLIAHPKWFQRLPRGVQDRLAVRSIRPAGAFWLRKRVDPLRVWTGVTVLSARELGEAVELRLSDGSTRLVDHVLLATGYCVDIGRYHFLNRDLVSRIRTVNGFPCLSPNFESSVPGLHFVGAPAAWSFGPLMRFVAGVGYAARKLTCGFARSKKQESSNANAV